MDYTTANGTALAGTDYTTTGGTINITAGNTTGSLVVTTLPDTIYEGDETFNVILSNFSNVTANISTGVGTINDDDPAPQVSV